ncbi:MAG: histidine phosphatase family protein [Anaerolineae bacterium]|nr:histidine phosphatase family protein [Anaerolineae bacterium]
MVCAAAGAAAEVIYVMRHGQSVVNLERALPCRRLEGDLTELGRTQAEQAARWFADKQIAHIRFSPFHRARQTAEIVVEVLGVTPILDEDLREANCGDMENLPFDEALSIWRRVYIRWLLFDAEARFPGGESYAEVVERFARAMRKCPPDESALLVTHGDITHTVIPPLCVNAAALQQVAPLSNTGIIILEHYDADRYTCSSWNLVDHLSD